MKKEIGTAKVIRTRLCFMGYSVSGDSQPSSAKNPGPDQAQTERFYRLSLHHSTETIDVHVLERQGGLNINPPQDVLSWQSVHLR